MAQDKPFNEKEFNNLSNADKVKVRSKIIYGQKTPPPKVYKRAIAEAQAQDANQAKLRKKIIMGKRSGK